MNDSAKSDQKKTPPKVKHPAKFSDPVLQRAREILDKVQPEGEKWFILDPFAGSGKIHQLFRWTTKPERVTFGLEIEPPWASDQVMTFQGDATAMGWGNDYFDCVFTSPCYGNRFADTFKPKDTSRRHTYIGYLREITGDPDYKLQENSACGLQWGEKYRELHRKALAEMWRVLKPPSEPGAMDGGLLLLNMSDHVRNYERVQVCKWWIQASHRAGFRMVHSHPILTQRMREGENNDLRVPIEMLFEMRKR